MPSDGLLSPQPSTFPNRHERNLAPTQVLASQNFGEYGENSAFRDRGDHAAASVDAGQADAAVNVMTGAGGGHTGGGSGAGEGCSDDAGGWCMADAVDDAGADTGGIQRLRRGDAADHVGGEWRVGDVEMDSAEEEDFGDDEEEDVIRPSEGWGNGQTQGHKEKAATAGLGSGWGDEEEAEVGGDEGFIPQLDGESSCLRHMFEGYVPQLDGTSDPRSPSETTTSPQIRSSIDMNLTPTPNTLGPTLTAALASSMQRLRPSLLRFRF